jgi:hypothetical protein
MYSLTHKIGVLAVASLATQVVALPSNNKPDPFSNASWPLPHNITGVSNPGVSQKYDGWGGVHLHDPSIVMGPDGHYYSFSTHGSVVISRASQPNSLDGYWTPIGSVLEGSSIINNTGNTDPWFVPLLSLHIKMSRWPAYQLRDAGRRMSTKSAIRITATTPSHNSAANSPASVSQHHVHSNRAAGPITAQS